MRKCNGHDLIVVFTNHRAYDAAAAGIPSGVTVLTPDTIGEFHNILA